MKLSTKAKTIISIVLFVVVFSTLITLATFFDFNVSQILTKNALPQGEYFATDFFGVFFECVGSQPIFLFAAFACCVFFWFFLKVWTKKPYNIILAVVCAFCTVLAFWFAIKDMIGYIFDHVFARISPTEFEVIDAYYHSAPVVAIEILIAAMLGAASIFATKHFGSDTLKKLARLCLTAIFAVAVANLLIAIVKTPVGRMRYRAINSTLGDSLIASGQVQGFTRWYVINKQPNEGILNGFKEWYNVEDAFKSFPSGHTCAAATSYVILMLPDLFEFKHKKVAKVACWVAPIAFTGIVAISRIVCGAHYMSDVTFGGTIAFVCMIIAREVLVCKGSHFFALFPQLNKKAVAVGEEQVSFDDQQSDVCDVEGQDESVAIDEALVEDVAEQEDVQCQQAPVGESE